MGAAPVTVYALLRRLLRLALAGHGRCECLVVLDHPEMTDIADHVLTWIHPAGPGHSWVVLVGRVEDHPQDRG